MNDFSPLYFLFCISRKLPLHARVYSLSLPPSFSPLILPVLLTHSLFSSLPLLPNYCLSTPFSITTLLLFYSILSISSRPFYFRQPSCLTIQYTQLSSSYFLSFPTCPSLFPSHSVWLVFPFLQPPSALAAFLTLQLPLLYHINILRLLFLPSSPLSSASPHLYLSLKQTNRGEVSRNEA